MSQTPIVFYNISCFGKKTQARMVKDEKSGGKKHTYTIDEKGGYKNPQPPILDLQCPSSQVPKCPSSQVPKCPSSQVPKCPSSQVPKCPRPKCTNLEDDGDAGGDGDEEGQRLRGGGK